MRAVLYLLHILYSQVLLAAQFSEDLVGPVAVIEVVPGCADIVRVVVAHRSLVGGEDDMVGRVVDLWYSIQAEIPVELHVYPRAFHGWDAIAPTAAISQRFATDRDQALKRALYPEPSLPAA